jgi:hypothetical protein
MAPIYSTKLVNADYPTPYSAVVYTVPVGARVVVTNIDYFTSGPSGTYFTVKLGAGYVIWTQNAANVSQMLRWEGKQVLNAGDTISIINGNVATLDITGYVLT